MYDFYHKPNYKPNTDMSIVLADNGYILEKSSYFRYISKNYKYISFLIICLKSDINIKIKNIDNIESLISDYLDKYIIENYFSFNEIIEFVILSSFYVSDELFKKIVKRFHVNKFSSKDKTMILRQTSSYSKLIYLVKECGISFWETLDYMFLQENQQENIVIILLNYMILNH